MSDSALRHFERYKPLYSSQSWPDTEITNASSIQMRKQKPRLVKYVVQGHTAR